MQEGLEQDTSGLAGRLLPGGGPFCTAPVSRPLEELGTRWEGKAGTWECFSEAKGFPLPPGCSFIFVFLCLFIYTHD